MSNSLALVIPALNEAESIGNVVATIKLMGDVVVVDDGSTDETGKIAGDAGAIVVRHAQNRGYDEALASGLQKAVDLGYVYAITVDADGQHSSDAVREIYRKLSSGADLVVGIRDRRQRVSETIFSLVSRFVWGLKDPLCGLKGYRLDKLRQIGPLCTYRSVGTELSLIGARAHWKTEQIPVQTAARIGASKFGRGLRANIIILSALLQGLRGIRVQADKHG